MSLKFKILKGQELIDATREEFFVWAESSGRIVRYDKIREVEIFTICFGMDHGVGSEPLFFETMVFHETTKHNIYTLHQEMYSTYLDAYYGHVSVCRILDPDFVVGPPNHKPYSASANDAEYYNYIIESQEALKANENV